MRATAARALTLPGLLLGLVLTTTLPAWAGAASARPDTPATACAADAGAPGDDLERPRC